MDSNETGWWWVHHFSVLAIFIVLGQSGKLTLQMFGINLEYEEILNFYPVNFASRHWMGCIRTNFFC